MEEEKYYRTAEPVEYGFLKSNARRMRKNMTLGEQALWECLRGSKLGSKFRRQHPMGEYIADFVCLTAKLVVEVDGEYHLTDLQQSLDCQRTEYLTRMGYRELRFSNAEVLFDIDAVINIIKSNLN